MIQTPFTIVVTNTKDLRSLFLFLSREVVRTVTTFVWFGATRRK